MDEDNPFFQPDATNVNQRVKIFDRVFNSPSLEEREASVLNQMMNKYNVKNIYDFDFDGSTLGSFNPKTRSVGMVEGRLFLDDDKNITSYGRNLLIAELAHAKQFNNPLKTMFLMKKLQSEQYRFGEDVYDTPGTIEYEAHENITPELREELFRRIRSMRAY